MAAECSKDVPLPLPVELEDYLPGYAMDIGGSITKLMYRSKEKLPPKDGISQRIRIAYLNRDNTDNLAAYIREHCDVPEHNDPIPIITTGVGGTQYNDAINEKLNVKATNIEEMGCFIKGVKLLSKHMSDEEFFYPIPPEALDDALPIVKGFLPMYLALGEKIDTDTLKDLSEVEIPEDLLKSLEPEHILSTYGKDTPRMPCALAMCGSGCALLNLADPEGGSFEMLAYSPAAGRQLAGLGRLLTGAKSYEELLSLAEKGDPMQVNVHNRDLRGPNLNDMYTRMPDEALTFCYGKGMDNDYSTFKKEDLAAAVVLNTIAAMVHYVLLECQNNAIDNVYLCGAMIDHPYARRCLMRAALELQLLETRPGKRVTVKMARYGTYIGVVGAWLLGLESQQKQKQVEKEK